MNLFEVMTRGGLVMWPILLCSLLVVYVILERWMLFRRARLDVGQFLLKLKSLYRHGDISAVLSYCSQKDSPIANIIRRGVLKHGQGVAKMHEAVEFAAREEMFGLERRLSLLASVSGVAPLLGFLGTVLGCIAVFQSIEHKGGLVIPAELAAGIWSALLSTAFGLSVGLVALVAYNWTIAHVRKLVHTMESASNDFLEMIDQPPEDNNGAGKDDVQMAMRSPMLDDDPFRRKE